MKQSENLTFEGVQMFLLRTSKSNFAIDNPPLPKKKADESYKIKFT